MGTATSVLSVCVAVLCCIASVETLEQMLSDKVLVLEAIDQRSLNDCPLFQAHLLSLQNFAMRMPDLRVHEPFHCTSGNGYIIQESFPIYVYLAYKHGDPRER